MESATRKGCILMGHEQRDVKKRCKEFITEMGKIDQWVVDKVTITVH